MTQITTLLTPRLLSFKNKKDISKGKLIIFGSLGVIFWGGLFVVSLRILNYFQSIEELGNILAWKLMSMTLVIYFSLLIFSSLLTVLSKLYLSKDLLLVHSTPVSGHQIFVARWLESAADSAWMIIIYTLPVLISYGIIYGGGVFYYCQIVLVLLLLSVIASIISAAVVMVAVIVMPAGRIKSIFVFLGLVLFLMLYLAFRLVRPERLVDPEAFETALTYLSVLNTPSSPLLPTSWAYDALYATLNGFTRDGILDLLLLLTCAGALISVTIIIADAIYVKGVSRSQTARKPLFKPGNVNIFRFFAFLPRPIQAFAVKEFKTFFRDQTQWSQIFLILALIIIYIYNFKVLPLDKSPIKAAYLQNILSFLNMGLASFVLTAVTGRFAYPAVSIEGEAFWLVRSAPVKIKTFLWIKFFIYFIPLLILTELLIVATNVMLDVEPFMMVLSVITILFIVPAVVSLGIGLGAAYPDFNAENAAQAITSFGGLMFMMVAAVYIAVVIVLESSPVYHIYMSDVFNRDLSMIRWIWVVGSFTLAAIVSILTLYYPMKYGERMLSGRMPDMPAFDMKTGVRND
jgi:ABC-2 type transport system permease protein